MPFSCFLFRPRKSRERRRKCSHTNVSNTLVTRPSTPPAQTATFAFTGESGYTLGFRRKIAHSRSHAETGAFPPSTTVRLCAASEILLFRHAFISATVLSQTIFHRDFQLLPQTAHVRFHGRKWVHTHLCSKDRTQGLTRRNRGCFGWGWHHYPRYELHVHEHPRAGYQDGKLCRFGVLTGGALEERRKPAGQRCAYACRCPTGVAAPPGCVIQ